MKIFNHPELQAFFNENGYVIVDFFNDEHIAVFLDFWEKKNASFDDGIFTSVYSWEPELNQELSDLMKRVANPLLETYMKDCYIEGATFLVKGKDKNNTHFNLHQDYNLVDEFEDISMGLWIPLVDTTEENGGLCVLPGTHRQFKGTIRSVNNPSLYIDINNPKVTRHIQNLTIKKGQACIFSHSLFHGSPANLKDEKRMVLHSGIFTKHSNFIHYFRNVENGHENIEILKVNRTDYYRDIKSFSQNPKAYSEVIGTTERYTKTPDIEHVISFMRSQYPQNKLARFLKKLMK